MLFKRNEIHRFYRIAITHIFTVIALLQKDIDIKIILIIWVSTVIIPNFVFSFFENLEAIEIDDKKLLLKFSKYFKESIKVYDYSNLKFTNETQTGTRGSKSIKFRIYDNNYDRPIVNIGGFLDGWTEDIINEITEKLKEKGVQVK